MILQHIDWLLMNPEESNDELRDENQLLVEAEICTDKWRRRTLVLACLLIASVISAVPFSAGQSLHAYFKPAGQILIWIAVALLTLFAASAGLTYTFWQYERALRRKSR